MYPIMKIVIALLWVSVATSAPPETDLTLVEYHLYTPDNLVVPHIIPHDASSLGNFDPSRRTFVLMHGLGDLGVEVFLDKGLNFAFNAAGSFNLVYVDWQSLAEDPLYVQAAKGPYLNDVYIGRGKGVPQMLT